jgi:Fe-S-cluster containining protein
MVTCEDCKGKCCKYIAIETDIPDCLDDWDQIKWLLMHEGVSVYLDNEGDWVVEVTTRCKNLGENNKCKIYDTRPDLCEDHEVETCVMNGTGKVEKILFKTAEDVDKYLKKEGLDKTLPAESPKD